MLYSQFTRSNIQCDQNFNFKLQESNFFIQTFLYDKLMNDRELN